MGRKLVILIFLILLILSYGVIRIGPAPKTEIEPPPSEVNLTSAPAAQAAQEAPPVEPTSEPNPPAGASETASMPAPQASASSQQEPLPHGLFYALVIPLVFVGIPWLILEIFIIRYVQPRGIDLTEVRIKAQDGLFIEAAVSMTARRSLTLASTRMTWPRVRGFVEKTIEQELLHEAIQFPTLDDLERNLKTITEKFLDLPIVQELSRDFGVEVLRFNVETRYPQETRDAIDRKADASAGGAAYLAYAAAAHLNPDTPECRQLYRIFQETSGQVDAARNLGGGITSLASMLSRKGQEKAEGGDGSSD